MIIAKRPELERLLAAPPLGLRGLLLHGKDRGAVREFAARMAAKIARDPTDPFDVARLSDDAVDPDPTRLFEELAALSMLGGRRLVWLQIAAEKLSVERGCSEALLAHLRGELNSEAFLLIEAGALEKGSPLRKSAEAAQNFASVILYADEVNDLRPMIRAALAEDGVSLDTTAMDMFINRLPQARGVVRQEIERLVLFIGPGRREAASCEALEDFFGVEPHANAHEAAAEAFGGRLRETQASLRRGRADGEGGAAALRALSQYLFKLRRAQRLITTGRDPAEACRASGVFWKSEREFLRQLTAWRLGELDRLQPDLYSADRAIKATGSPDTLIAERTFMAVAGRARRLGL